MNKKILVSYQIPADGFDELRADGFEVIFPAGMKLSDEEMEQHMPGTTVFVSNFGHKLSNDAIQKADSLKMIANYGVGYDNLDIPFITSQGIIATNTPKAVTEPTAEIAMGLMLALCRRIGEFNHRIKTEPDLRWGVPANFGTTLYGKKLGIIGLGAIGKALARRALAFGMQISYFSRNRLPFEIEQQFQAQYLSLNELLTSSDIVSLNMPLNKETRKMIGAKEFNAMKNSAFLINTARGGVVDEMAMIEALNNGAIAGAGLDVFEREPKIPQELIDLPNVVLTPHLGTATFESRKEMAREVARNIRQFFEGKMPESKI